MGFVRFVFLIPWMAFVACVHMKHYTLRVAAPFPPWDSRQQSLSTCQNLKPTFSMLRLRVVPHLSLGIVERAKRERA